MAMTIPTIPVLPAGYVAQVADMNNLSSMATFLLTKPMARVHDGVGTGTLTANASTVTTYSVKDFDTDGMWNVSSPTRLTIQTPGWYRVRYGVCITTASLVSNTYAIITTGANNPAGSGVITNCWPGSCYGGAAATLHQVNVSGILPAYLYALDWISVSTYMNAAATYGLATVPSFLALEFVSTL